MKDLMPKCVSEFHESLVKDYLKYSNLKILQKNVISISIKIKDVLFNVGVFIKMLPNLSTGFIYIISIRKLSLKHFIIVTDSLFKINAMSDNINILTNSLVNKINQHFFNFDINRTMLGKNIILLIPDILKILTYKNDKFIFENIKNEYKGVLYTNTHTINEHKIFNLLDKIKEEKKLYFYEISRTKSNISKSRTNKNFEKNEFNELINECKKCNGINFNIYFTITKKSYFNDRFCFYKFFIQSDSNSIEMINYILTKNSSDKYIKKKNKNKIKKNHNIKAIKIDGNTNKSETILIEDENLTGNQNKNINLNINEKNKNETINIIVKPKISKEIKNELIYLKIKNQIIKNKSPKYFFYQIIPITIFSIITFIL